MSKNTANDTPSAKVGTWERARVRVPHEWQISLIQNPYSMSKHSETIQRIREKGSEKYMALRILSGHDLLMAFKNPDNTPDENAAIRQELLERMSES